jgi:hypothetical protein
MCFSIHVTYYQANICEEHVELCNNLFNYYLVAGFIILGFFCYGAGHCNNVCEVKLIMGEFKDSQGFKV